MTARVIAAAILGVIMVLAGLAQAQDNRGIPDRLKKLQEDLKSIGQDQFGGPTEPSPNGPSSDKVWTSEIDCDENQKSPGSCKDRSLPQLAQDFARLGQNHGNIKLSIDQIHLLINRDELGERDEAAFNEDSPCGESAQQLNTALHHVNSEALGQHLDDLVTLHVCLSARLVEIEKSSLVNMRRVRRNVINMQRETDIMVKSACLYQKRQLPRYQNYFNQLKYECDIVGQPIPPAGSR